MKRLFANAGKKKDKQQQYQQQPPYAGQDYPADTAPHANGVNYGGPTSSQPPPQHQQQYAQGPIVPTHQPYVIMQPLVPPVTQVSNAIGWSCASAQFDYAYILSLADHLSSSSLASKEAARALRKEFKHATVDAQERAVRLTGILMRNTDVRFREQVASKKFLAELQDLCTNRKTDSRVADMVLRVLSPLAYDYQRDADLSPITNLYNKLKPADWPVNGAPLDPEDPLLTPTADPRLSAQQQQQRRRPKPAHRVPTTTEQLDELRVEAEQAKGYAQMLSEALAYAGQDDDLYENELVMEFHAKCLSAQEHLSDNLQWATVQAEQSRQALTQDDSAATTLSPSEPLHRSQENAAALSPAPASGDPIPQLSSNNPFAPIVQGRQSMPPPTPARQTETTEEQTLSVVLPAYSTLAEALSAFEAHAQARRERAELHEVQERSRGETRFDRANAGVPDHNGDYLNAAEEGRGGAGAGVGAASGSRGPSVELVRETVPGQSSSPAMATNRQSVHHQQEGSSWRNSTTTETHPQQPSQQTRARTPALDQARPAESRNPYAAYLSQQSVEPTHQDSHEQHNFQQPDVNRDMHNDGGGGFFIPDSFDSQRPLSVTRVTPPIRGGVDGDIPRHQANSALRTDATEPGFSDDLDYLDYSELHDEPPSPLVVSAPGPTTMNPFSTATTGPVAAGPRRQGTSDSGTSTTTDVIETPAEPSAKALGKLRRLSVREDTETDVDEQQRRLEEALRARYH